MSIMKALVNMEIEIQMRKQVQEQLPDASPGLNDSELLVEDLPMRHVNTRLTAGGNFMGLDSSKDPVECGKIVCLVFQKITFLDFTFHKIFGECELNP